MSNHTNPELLDFNDLPAEDLVEQIIAGLSEDDVLVKINELRTRALSGVYVEDKEASEKEKAAIRAEHRAGILLARRLVSLRVSGKAKKQATRKATVHNSFTLDDL